MRSEQAERKKCSHPSGCEVVFHCDFGLNSLAGFFFLITLKMGFVLILGQLIGLFYKLS